MAGTSDPWRDCCGTGGTATYQNNPGDLITVPVTLVTPASNPGVTWKTHIEIQSDPSFVDYLGYDCDGPVACIPNTTVHFGLPPGFQRQAGVCISLPTSNTQVTIRILTVKLRLKQIGSSTIAVALSSHPTSCDIDDSNNHYAGNGFGMTVVGQATGTTGDDTGDTGGGDDGSTSATSEGTGSGSEAGGRDKTGSGGSGPNNNDGGTGGGSSANRRGEKDPSLPSSSGLGDSEQSGIEPSPFFDGKQFAIGSSADSTNAVSIGGIKLGYGWFYLLGALILLGLGGWFVWKRLDSKTKLKFKARISL